MTDKRKNNGGHSKGGRRSFGQRREITFRLPTPCAEWLDKQANKNAALVALIEKEIKQSID